MGYPDAAWERAMTVQEVMLKAVSGELHWFQAATSWGGYRGRCGAGGCGMRSTAMPRRSTSDCCGRRSAGAARRSGACAAAVSGALMRRPYLGGVPAPHRYLTAFDYERACDHTDVQPT